VTFGLVAGDCSWRARGSRRRGTETLFSSEYAPAGRETQRIACTRAPLSL
jgi:hypothetical protein